MSETINFLVGVFLVKNSYGAMDELSSLLAYLLIQTYFVIRLFDVSWPMCKSIAYSVMRSHTQSGVRKMVLRSE